MSQNGAIRSNFAVVAAGAWAIVPAAWGISTLLESDGGGDSFTVLGVLGWAALIAAGASMLLAVLRAEVTPGRTRLFQTGLVFHGLGLLTSAVMFWAVPVWAGLYSIAMVLYAIAAPQARSAALVIAGAMAAGVASLVVLTALEVGTPDPIYGDYPIAWTSAFSVAAIGGAIGNFLLWKQGVSSEPATPAMV